jgi:MFS family permease
LLSFREDYGKLFGEADTAIYIIPATWQSIYGGVSQLTAIVGAIATGWISDRIGRRYTNAIFCAISIVGVAIQYVSTYNGSLPILTVGKGINGFSIGAWLILGPLYASEVAPLKLRGWLTAMTNFVQFSGTLLFTGIIYKLGPMNTASAYVIPFVCQWIIPAIVILTVWFWPESPVWLVRMERMKEAEKALKRLHGETPAIDRSSILTSIQVSIRKERESRTENSNLTYAACFAPVDRARTLICMFIYGCQYLSGIVFVLGYQSYYYQLAGYGAEKSFLLGMLNNCSMFVANILSWPLLTVIGRRSLIVWGQFLCALTLLIIGGASTSGQQPAILVTIAFMFIWVSTLSIGLQPPDNTYESLG